MTVTEGGPTAADSGRSEGRWRVLVRAAAVPGVGVLRGGSHPRATDGRRRSDLAAAVPRLLAGRGGAPGRPPRRRGGAGGTADRGGVLHRPRLGRGGDGAARRRGRGPRQPRTRAGGVRARLPRLLR